MSDIIPFPNTKPRPTDYLTEAKECILDLEMVVNDLTELPISAAINASVPNGDKIVDGEEALTAIVGRLIAILAFMYEYRVRK